MLVKQVERINILNLNYYIYELKIIVVYIQVSNTKRIKIINCITKNQKIIK